MDQISLMGMIFGLLGGLIRALVGVGKHLEKKKNKFNPTYFFFTVILSGLIGAIVGSLILNDLRFALAAGYAGSDLLEGLYRVKQKRMM